ncbi:hypothetical protein GA830_10270 [Mesorhizobium sp. NBSH29]|uniref:hypothetical protein n=1 Tax=Mesorhizobium sp. NBSH29 TaxID=2654249 RepID=UPI0018965ED4|nr:hypothetical protein [Mesorhizobium sp. NBSH29]QPC87080.1 hypothetical protein GA830_10270 [Mesorhizobium sp. NBSH29]
MKPDRIPCINPRCGRTAPAAKYPAGWEIVCHKCWKMAPPSLVKRHRQLSKRRRKIDRLIRMPGLGFRTNAIDRLQHANWCAIRVCFNPVDRPEGLDAFIEEVFS